MRTNPLLLCLVLLACGGTAPSTSNPVRLRVPDALDAVAGATTWLDVGVEGADPADLKLAAASGGAVKASVDGLRVRLDVPGTASGEDTLSLSARSSAGEAAASVRVKVVAAAKQATRDPGVHVRLDSLFYADGAPVRVAVDLGGRPAPATLPDVVLVSSAAHDVERVALRRLADGSLESIDAVTVRASTAASAPLDGALAVPAGGLFVAFFAFERAWPGFEDLEVSFVSDLGVVDGAVSGAPASRVEPSLALTGDEAQPPAGGRAAGTLLRQGAPVQVATRELVVFHADDAELGRFLASSRGTVLRTEEVGGDKPFASLVEVDPSSMSSQRLAQARALAGDEGELLASRAEAAAIYGLALAARLDGFVVAVNPRLQYQAAPRLAEPEASTVTGTMQLRGTPTETRSCLPGSSTRPCTTDVPALWAYLDLMDVDSQRIKVAVLDMGFSPNADFRVGADGGIDQCDFTGGRVRCGADAALGPPTVGASVVGPRVWHGTGVVTTLGGVVDNGFGAAGVAGQVAVPMLYKYDLAAYAFDMGRGIRQALGQGAQVINISAGYPCRVVSTVGPDFDICSVEGRLAICGVVTAAVHTAAIAFCTSPAAGIPIVGAAICGSLAVAATVATEACLSTLALGNVRSTMASAVADAVSRGVPVVASAGNQLSRESFPEGVRDYVDFREIRTEAWGIIPATLPGVLAIGAAEGADLRNTQFTGERVDVWAPSNSAFISPDDAHPGTTFVDHINATSGAAPYVAGTIAAMQAVNPSLDPARASAAERATAVARVRELLVSTAISNATLASRGFANDPNRRNLVDPLAAVQAAARGNLPDLGALGYDTTLNFSEADGADDTQASARPMPFDTRVAGTLFSFDSSPADEDFVRFTMPSVSGRVFGADVTVRWLGRDEPTVATVTGAALPRLSTRVEGDEHVSTYRLVRASGEAVVLRVATSAGADVPYVLSVATPTALTPTVSIDEPVLTPGQSLCANRPITFRASATYPFSTLTATSGTWTVDGASQPGTSLTTSFSRPAGSHTFTITVLGGTDSLTATFVDCTVVAQIVTPAMNVRAYADGMDANGPYLGVSLSGRALDAMGNVLPAGSLYFEWTTSRGDLQPGAPASGAQVVATGASPGLVRLYGGPSGWEEHLVTLIVRQAPGGAVLSTVTVRVVVQTLI